MASKGVIDRHRVAKVIAAAARIHARDVGTRLQEVLAPAFPDGEVPFDGVQLLDGLARYLDLRIEAMNQADETHLGELRDDDEPRRRRDEAAGGEGDRAGRGGTKGGEGRRCPLPRPLRQLLELLIQLLFRHPGRGFQPIDEIRELHLRLRGDLPHLG